MKLMTSAERREHAERVENGLDVLQLEVSLLGTCKACQDAYGMEAREFYAAVHENEADPLVDEGSFSWHDCELCGSGLGGNRYAAHVFVRNSDDVVHLDVCAECVLVSAGMQDEWSDETEIDR